MQLRSYSLTILTVFAAALMTSCAASKTSEGIGLNPTIYYKPTVYQNEAKCTTSEMRELLSPEGKTLVSMCEKDYDNCLLQGSCFVDDGTKVTSYNYHSTKDDVPRFIIVDTKKCPFGYGVRNICLDPFFSVAADLSIYEPGEVLFIPRLVGATLPNGEMHDGYVIVRDAGGAIKGPNRFDFFTGFLDHRQRKNTLVRLGFSDPKNRFEFRRATEEERNDVQVRRAYPGLKESVIQEGQRSF
jgi:3D (Asp-Asp-Asp) domain-containing protein